MNDQIGLADSGKIHNPDDMKKFVFLEQTGW